MISVFNQVDARLVTPEVTACFESLDSESPLDYRQLAPLLVNKWRQSNTRFIGLSGGQGTGKTTLGKLIQAASEWFGESAVVLSLDDFYLTRQERKTLASTQHPLLATRGPPGTHDTDLLSKSLGELLQGETTVIPQFDKSLDDRVGEVRLDPTINRVLLEGWCVGAHPETDLETLKDPINALERDLDSDGRWREYVNQQLQDSYQTIWQQMDSLVYLCIGDMASIRRWRFEQESSIPEALRKSEEWVNRFVQYYERITQRMGQELPESANVVVNLDSQHKVTNVLIR